MTETPGPKQAAKNCPEPPFEELYALYLESHSHDRAKLIRRAAEVLGDRAMAQRIEDDYLPLTREEFQQELATRHAAGTRERYVNRLVLGWEHCAAHPDDPRTQPCPEEAKMLWVELTNALARELQPPRWRE